MSFFSYPSTPTMDFLQVLGLGKNPALGPGSPDQPPILPPNLMLSSFCSKVFNGSLTFQVAYKLLKSRQGPWCSGLCPPTQAYSPLPKLLVSYFALEASHNRRTLFSHSFMSSWLGTPSPVSQANSLSLF